MPKTTAKAKATESEPQASARGVKVTYIPLEHRQRFINQQGELVLGAVTHDGPVIKWNGVTFHANVPVLLDPERHFVLIDKPKILEQSDGSIRTITRETRVSMIELAKGNPSFKVDGCPRAKRKISTRVVPPPGAEWEGKHEGEISEADWDTATHDIEDMAA